MNGLSVKKLSAAYSKNQVLNDISLELNPGEFVCLCGKNGSGKSTLLSLLAGIPSPQLKITAAEQPPFINGTELSKLKRKEIAKLISYMPQTALPLWDFTVFDTILSGRFAFTKNGFYTNQDKEIAGQIIKELGLEKLSDKSVKEISGGEFQKVRLARCLCQKTPFLILDEPTTSLDFFAEPEFLELLKEQAHNQKLGILITLHNLPAAAKADRLLLLPALHSIVEATPDTALNTSEIAYLLKI